MGDNANLAFVEETMLDFADITGLSPARTNPQRYLWTDAFAVCNYLELFRLTKRNAYRDLALGLVDQVHQVLGRHRPDDRRKGWIGGLGEEEGGRHPTIGGLRIGKERPERRIDEPVDERSEWDQDGQYYHYLTKWMHALNRVGQVTQDPTYLRWAMELAQKAHWKFTYSMTAGGRRRMYWKMSIDLSYPLVSSMGQHDTLDGYLTYCELQTAAKGFPAKSVPLNLAAEISDMAGICKGGGWDTDDPLGIGGMLSDAFRIGQLMVEAEDRHSKLLGSVLDSAIFGLESYLADDPLALPASHRMAFRELGLSIGLKGIMRLRSMTEDHPRMFGQDLISRVDSFRAYSSLGESIERFWMDPRNRRSDTWTEHYLINTVMLATSLAPGGFLRI